MNILVIFASHRLGGTNAEVEKMLIELPSAHRFEFIHLADHKVEGCHSCHQCGRSETCVLPPSPDDHFQEIFDRMIAADAVLIISPVYAGIPSRLTALFERMTSVLYDSGRMNTDKNPLLNKKVGIFSYCSSGVCADGALKLIFDKFVMKNYRFDVSTYPYLNGPDYQRYGSIIEYVKDVVTCL
jgi:multimeric flavodoxin WrbA